MRVLELLDRAKEVVEGRFMLSLLYIYYNIACDWTLFVDNAIMLFRTLWQCALHSAAMESRCYMYIDCITIVLYSTNNADFDD
jgi:hypothetical protein